jgi:hypothetical protein
VQKSAEAADESAPVHEKVNQHQKPIDEGLTKNLPVLVVIGREILVLLKCVVGLVC